MKKIIALLLVVCMIAAFAGCSKKDKTPATEAPATEATEAATLAPETPTGAPEAEGIIMTHADYVAAELETPVVVETYVQATQSWWNNKINVYAQSEDGAYFLYEMECAEEAAKDLVPGTKIRVSGFKAEWSGEVEIIDATFEVIDGNYIAAPVDMTDLLGTDALIAHQNELASFTGLTVDSIEFKNGEPGDDIYVAVKKGDQVFNFCVEFYLTGADTDVYKTVSELKAGDVVDIEGFLYWYEGVNTHITSVTVK